MTTLTLSPKVSVTSRVEDLLWQGGLIIIAFLPVTFLVSLYDPRQLNEINIWSKPMKFYASVGLHMITIAFIARFIDYDVRRKFSVYVLGWVLTFTAIFDAQHMFEEVGGSVAFSVQQPRLTCRASDVDEIVEGDKVTLTVEGVLKEYKIRAKMPDGTGITELQLEEQ